MGCPKRLNKHEIFIRTEDCKLIFDQLVLWGEAPWWPSKCLMRFKRIDNEPIRKGTMYHQEVRVPFGPRWCSVVSDIDDNKSISRKYLGSFIDGEEVTRVKPVNGGAKVEYELSYSIQGFFYQWAWERCLRSLHDANIQKVLDHLKTYIEKQ